MLSKIECGKAIPSLGMLHRVAVALETSIAELFNAAEAQDFVLYRAGERPAVTIGPRSPDAGIRLERLVPFSPDRSLEGNIHVVMPGAIFGGAIKHAGEEVGYVVSGQLELTVGERVSLLEEGDSFFFRSDLPHSYRNLRQRACRRGVDQHATDLLTACRIRSQAAAPSRRRPSSGLLLLQNGSLAVPRALLIGIGDGEDIRLGPLRGHDDDIVGCARGIETGRDGDRRKPRNVDFTDDRLMNVVAAVKRAERTAHLRIDDRIQPLLLEHAR